MFRTHLLVKLYSVAEEGRVVDEAEASAVLWHVALEQQLLVQLDTDAGLKHSGVPQAVDHDDHVVVELTERLPADVKGLLKNTSKTQMTKTKMQESGEEGVRDQITFFCLSQKSQQLLTTFSSFSTIFQCKI